MRAFFSVAPRISTCQLLAWCWLAVAADCGMRNEGCGKRIWSGAYIYCCSRPPQSLPSPIPVAGLVRAWAPCPGPPGPPGPRQSTAAATCGLVRWPASSLVDVCDLSKFHHRHHHQRSAVSLLLLIRDSESAASAACSWGGAQGIKAATGCNDRAEGAPT